jgi:hypothetical protein
MGHVRAAKNFTPDQTTAMKKALELAWAVLAFRYELDKAAATRARDMLALTILALANDGERDPHALCEGALRARRQLSGSPPVAGAP